MLSDSVSIALTLVQLVALTLPALAILIQAMMSFEEGREGEWRAFTSGWHEWSMSKRYGLVFYSFMGLYLALGASLAYIYLQADIPPLLSATILVLLVSFGLLMVAMSSFSWIMDHYLTR